MRLRLAFSLNTWIGAVQRIVAELRKHDFVTTEDLRARLLEQTYDVVYPIGSPIPTFESVVPDESVFIMLQGQSLAVSDFPRLFAKYRYTFGGSGGVFTLPNGAGKALFGKTAAGTGSTLGGTVGGASLDLTVSVTIPGHYHSKGNLAIGSSGTHTTAIDHNHASFTSGAGGAHTHSIDHDHGSFTSGAGSSHTHPLNSLNRAIYAGNNFATGPTGAATSQETATGAEAAHTHAIDVPNFTGTSGSESAHTHAVDVPALTQDSASTGAHTHANGDFTGSVGDVAGEDGDDDIEVTSGSVVVPGLIVNWMTRY